MTIDKYNLANLFLQFKDKNGKTVFNVNDTLTFDFSDTASSIFINHVVGEKDTYQTISYRYYGTTRLWWIIAKINNVEDATIRPEAATIIKVLNPQHINFVSANLQNAEN